QKSVARGAAFVELLFTAIAVDANRRCIDENAGLVRQRSDRLRDERCPAHAAVVNSAPCVARPALRDVLTGEVDHDGRAIDRRRVDRAGFGIPRDLARRAWRAPHESVNVMPARLERFDERRAYETVRAGDDDHRRRIYLEL